MNDFRKEVASGDMRRSLVAMRDVLAEAIEEQNKAMKAKSGMCRKCGGDASAGSGIAAMSLRLRQVLQDLEALPREEEETKRDAIANSRSARRASNATGVALPTNPLRP